MFFIISTTSAQIDIENSLKDIDIQHLDSGMDQVDCVYIINLEIRPEKWVETKNSLDRYGIQANRVPAINGWLLSQEKQQLLLGSYPMRLRGGQIGCILSHLSTLKDAYKRDYNIIWVCEDDIEIYENPHQISSLITLLSKIDSEWDILYTDSDSKNSEGTTVLSLGSDFRPDSPHEKLSYYIKRKLIHKDILKIHQRFGAYSMLISKKGIEKILTYFMNRDLWTAYDIDIHYIPHIRQYCLTRDLVSINYKKKSDTESNLK